MMTSKPTPIILAASILWMVVWHSRVSGQVVWDSGGFESPKYKPGELAGQDGWVNPKTGPNELCEIVADDQVSAARQVLYAKGGNLTTEEVAYIERTFEHQPGAEAGIYVFSFKVYPLSDSGAQQLPWFSFYSDGKQPVIQLVNYSGSFWLSEEGKAVNTANPLMKITSKTWYAVQIVMDFSKDAHEVVIQKLDANGKAIATAKDHTLKKKGVTADNYPARLVIEGTRIENNTTAWVGGAYLDDLKLVCGQAK